MRIPWFICIPCILGVVAGVLWWGSRDHDFVTEPSPDQLSRSTTLWQKKHPRLPEPKLISTRDRFPSPPDENQLPKPPPKIQTGDLVLSPALDHYIENADLGSAPLLDLAGRLEAANAPAFALLAYERVLDNTTPTTEQRNQALKAIERLRPEIPVWNPDPSNSLPIVLHLRLPLPTKKILSAQIGRITADLQAASSHQVAPQILLTDAPTRPGFPPPPISLWLSGIGDNSPETPKLTFAFTLDNDSPKEVTEQRLREKLYTALYRTITSRLKQQTQLTPPPPLKDTPPRLALTTHITRLHWHKLAHSLTPQTLQTPQTPE